MSAEKEGEPHVPRQPSYRAKPTPPPPVEPPSSVEPCRGATSIHLACLSQRKTEREEEPHVPSHLILLTKPPLPLPPGDHRHRRRRNHRPFRHRRSCKETEPTLPRSARLFPLRTAARPLTVPLRRESAKIAVFIHSTPRFSEFFIISIQL